MRHLLQNGAYPKLLKSTLMRFGWRQSHHEALSSKPSQAQFWRFKLGYNLRMPRATNQLDQSKFLTEEEWGRFERLCRGSMNIPSQERNSLAMLLLFRTGARAGEFLNLKPEDFFERQSALLIRGEKGSKNREIVVPAYLSRALKSYLSRNPDLDLIFPIGYHRLRQVWEWYRPCERPLHALRHTFALETFKKTRDIHLVQIALGHRSISNTMIYVEYYYSTLELKRAVF